MGNREFGSTGNRAAPVFHFRFSVPSSVDGMPSLAHERWYAGKRIA